MADEGQNCFGKAREPTLIREWPHDRRFLLVIKFFTMMEELRNFVLKYRGGHVKGRHFVVKYGEIRRCSHSLTDIGSLDIIFI